jgi:hypothetical protein
MLIPGEVCAELTAETAHRLKRDDLFVAFTDMDCIAQSELRGGLGRLEHKKRNEIDELALRNTSLARASIFFACDTSGDLHAVPWVRSLERSPLVQHHEVGLEFKRFASKTYAGVELDTPHGEFPDAVAGLVIPYNEGVVFLGNASSHVPEGHRKFVNHMQQQLLADHDIALHAQLGSFFLQAGVNIAGDK